MHGDQTLYTAFITGRAYDARGPPPYPCVRCNGMHWSFHPCFTGAQQPPSSRPLRRAPTPHSPFVEGGGAPFPAWRPAAPG